MFSSNDIEIAAKTIFGEARGEYGERKGGLASLIAVANVILNRYRLSDDRSIDGVCRKPRQFSCWNKNDPNHDIVQNVSSKNPTYKLCEQVAMNVFSGQWPDLTKGATHYYSSKVLGTPPKWADGQRPLVEIGNHVFFKVQ